MIAQILGWPDDSYCLRVSSCLRSAVGHVGGLLILANLQWPCWSRELSLQWSLISLLGYLSSCAEGGGCPLNEQKSCKSLGALDLALRSGQSHTRAFCCPKMVMWQ